MDEQNRERRAEVVCPSKLGLRAVKAAIEQTQGPEYWRSLEELADSPILEEFVRREFPQQAEEWIDPVERRTFLKLSGWIPFPGADF